jgi:hypothetical protein
MMSPDLADFVAKEALAHKCWYCEWHEDHDVSTMAFFFPDPLNLVPVGLNQQFWDHPVKEQNVNKWDAIWARETARMNRTSS